MIGMLDTSKIRKTPDCALYLSHHYCDYIELLALISDEDGISQDDVFDKFHESGDITDTGTEGAAQENDKWLSRINDFFSEIAVRESIYGNAYPFQILGNRILKRSQVSDQQLCYITLLLCSSLRYTTNRSIFTGAFEYISFLVTSSYLPAGAQTHIFGVSSGQNTRYTGSLENKITLLANDLGENLKLRPNSFNQGNNGDGGADIVAWLPYQRDINKGRKLVLLGQSASGNNWETKQASVARLENFIDFSSPPVNVLFVPYDFRDVNRNFVSNSHITAGVVFDRFRIMELIDPQTFFGGNAHSNLKNEVLNLFNYVEDIV
jgi:hypothetical protein